MWLAGDSIQQYQVGSNGAIRMGIDGNGRVFGSADVGAAMQRIVSSTRGTHVFERDMAALGARAIDAELALRTALKPASDALFGTADDGTLVSMRCGQPASVRDRRFAVRAR